jgi:alpha-galactosidase
MIKTEFNMTKSIMKYVRIPLILGLFIAIVSCSKKAEMGSKLGAENTPPIDKTLALKPPMGWNSWNCYGWTVTEAQVKANADYMAKNLKQLGYEYIIVDATWYGDAAASDFEAFVHETIPVKPNYNLDEYGRLIPDTTKFPSSKNGKGFKPLADYVHSLGLKFGVHIMRGIPWKAADNNTKILGSDAKAASIAQPDSGCVWYDGYYGIDMKKPGGQEYYNSIFKLYADWGLDFVKADDVVNIADLEGISKAIRNSGRKMVLSVVPDNIPYPILKENAHMARTGFDMWDVWEMLKKGFPTANSVVKYTEPGFWPDLDILPIGKIGIGLSYKGPKPRIANFNKNELHALLSLWYISRMPLFFGGNLPETDPTTLDLITNNEAIAVNQNSENSRQIKFKNANIIWAADIPKSDDKYLAFFNQWESVEPIHPNITWKQLGLSGNEYKVRDLWAKKDLGSFKDGFTRPINAHDAGLYKIYK